MPLMDAISLRMLWVRVSVTPSVIFVLQLPTESKVIWVWVVGGTSVAGLVVGDTVTDLNPIIWYMELKLELWVWPGLESGSFCSDTRVPTLS